MRAVLVWLVILNVYTHRESGKHENTFPTSLKGDCLKVVEFSFEELLCLVAILTFTSSEEVHSWVPAIVIRFSSLMFIFLEVIWWGWYMDPIPLYEWQCYILSYSGCQRAVEEWWYSSHELTRKVQRSIFNRKRDKHTWAFLGDACQQVTSH